MLGKRKFAQLVLLRGSEAAKPGELENGSRIVLYLHCDIMQLELLAARILAAGIPRGP
jgi:hypothetical protein